MGGFGSGRSGGRPTTENGLALSLSKLLRDRLFRPGCAWSGSIVWTNTATGEQVGSIGFESHLNQDSGRVRLKYTTTRRDGERRESLAGLKPGRTSQDQLVVCSNIGMAVCDVVVAREVFDRALARNLGRKLPL